MQYRNLLLCMILSLLVMTTAQGADPGKVGKATSLVRWLDGKTGDTLFTSNDIVRFDWQQQLFELTRERAIEVMSRTIDLHRSFMVQDDRGVIYVGHFVSPISSQIFPGPTIMWDMSEITPPLFSITGGYPYAMNKVAHTEYSPRLLDDLKRAGVLAPIDRKKAPTPIIRRYSPLVEINTDLSSRIAFFPEQFTAGNSALVQVYLQKGPKGAGTFDVLSIHLRLTDGTAQSDEQQVLAMTPEAFSAEHESDYRTFNVHFQLERGVKLTDRTHLLCSVRFYQHADDGREQVVKESNICDVAILGAK